MVPLEKLFKENHWYTSEPFVTAIFALLVLLPLSLFKKMSQLRFTSLFSIIVVMGFIIFVIVGYFIDIGKDTKEGQITIFRLNLDIFSVLSIVTFAFSCHSNILTIAKEVIQFLKYFYFFLY